MEAPGISGCSGEGERKKDDQAAEVDCPSLRPERVAGNVDDL
jgi:hypothetical protein